MARLVAGRSLGVEALGGLHSAARHLGLHEAFEAEPTEWTLQVEALSA